MRDTIVINLMGGPGVGKSTFATKLFVMMKQKGLSCEYVDEFAKGLVWENRNFALQDQLYILGNQNHNLNRVNGKVNVIITDSPILLSMYYNRNNPKASQFDFNIFDKLVLDCYSHYKNIVLFLKRNFDYSKEGRRETEEQSIQANEKIKNLLDKQNIKYKEIYGSDENAQKIVNYMEKYFAKKNSVSL